MSLMNNEGYNSKLRLTIWKEVIIEDSDSVYIKVGSEGSEDEDKMNCIVFLGFSISSTYQTMISRKIRTLSLFGSL
jgi:hypothetical protein